MPKLYTYKSLETFVRRFYSPTEYSTRSDLISCGYPRLRARARAIRLIYRDIKFVRARLRDRDRSLIAAPGRGGTGRARPVLRRGEEKYIVDTAPVLRPGIQPLTFLVTPRSSRFHGKDTEEMRIRPPLPLGPRALSGALFSGEFPLIYRRIKVGELAVTSRLAIDPPMMPRALRKQKRRTAAIRPRGGRRNTTIRMRYTASRCRYVEIAAAGVPIVRRFGRLLFRASPRVAPIFFHLQPPLPKRSGKPFS